MIARQEEASSESLVPPRPNLGPEPWPEPSPWPGAAGWGAGLALIVLIVLVRARRRRKGGSPIPDEVSCPTVDPDRSPRQRLIASSEVVRGALIGAFGPAWGSKTTEEIGDDPALLERFGPDQVGRLIAFLKGADRVKFASAEPETLDHWEAWAASFASEVAAGATSRSIGK